MTDLLQLLLNGLMAGAVLAIPAIGLSAIYAVLRFPNFAVGGMATVGAYAGYAANTVLHWPAAPCLLVAFVAAGAVGVAADETVLRQLRATDALAAAIASIALNIVIENAVRFGFGNDLRGYDLPVLRDWHFGPPGLRLSRRPPTPPAPPWPWPRCSCSWDSPETAR